LAVYLQKAARWQGSKAKLDEIQAQLSIATSRANIDEKETGKLFNQLAGQYLNTVGGAAGGSVSQRLLSYVQKAQADGHIDNAEKESLIQGAEAARATLKQGIYDLATANRGVPQSAIDAAIKRADDTIGEISHMIENDKVGILAFNTRTEGSKIDDAGYELLHKDPDFAKAVTDTKILRSRGLDTAAEMYLQKRLQDGKNFPDKTAWNLTLQTLTRPGTFTDISENIRAASGDPAHFQESLKMLQTMLTDPKTNPEAKAEVIRVLMSEEYRNKSWLTNFDGTDGGYVKDGEYMFTSRETLYYDFISPGAVAAATELQTKDPQAWANFKTWAVDEAFQSLFGTALNETAEQGSGKYDPKTQQFVLTAKEPKETDPGAVALDQPGKHMAWAAKRDAVMRINTWIQRIKPLLKADGLDAGEEIRRVMKERRLSKPNTISSWLYQALPEEAEEGVGNAKKESAQ
jgi:hypothetical protein